MNSPIYMTESREEGAIFEISENFLKIKSLKSQSSVEFFENLSFEDELNLEHKFDEFLGDSEDSTEISLIISNLSSSNFSNLNSENQKADSENDSENTEILNILKRHPQTTKNIPCRGYSHGNSNFNNANIFINIWKLFNFVVEQKYHVVPVHII